MNKPSRSSTLTSPQAQRVQSPTKWNSAGRNGCSPPRRKWREMLHCTIGRLPSAWTTPTTHSTCRPIALKAPRLVPIPASRSPFDSPGSLRTRCNLWSTPPTHRTSFPVMAGTLRCDCTIQMKTLVTRCMKRTCSPSNWQSLPTRPSSLRVQPTPRPSLKAKTPLTRSRFETKVRRGPLVYRLRLIAVMTSPS